MMLKTGIASTSSQEFVHKRSSVLDNLREQIVCGILAPGMRLPTRRDLESQFDCSPLTVQRALDILIRDGFVVADGRRGTHVAEHPPHLSQYALVFRHHPETDRQIWTRYYSALSQQAVAMNNAKHPRISIRTGLEGHSDNVGFRQLLDDIQAKRLAGIMFADGFGLLENHSLVQNPKLPLVLRTDSEWTPEENRHIDTVQLDFDSFYQQALEKIWSRGRRKLAILTHRSPDTAQAVIERARAVGFRVETSWVQHVTVEFAFASTNIMHLLMTSRVVPDALLITDDNLVEHATLGLHTAGRRDLDIVAHCNIPHLPRAHVPVNFLGFDAREWLKQAIGCIDARRNGKVVPRRISLDATWV